jgi:hypothetical protein
VPHDTQDVDDLANLLTRSAPAATAPWDDPHPRASRRFSDALISVPTSVIRAITTSVI